MNISQYLERIQIYEIEKPSYSFLSKLQLQHLLTVPFENFDSDDYLTITEGGTKMQCPKCQFDNREGAKFCIDCRTKLEINCSKCSHLNPPASKYCEECGSKLNLLPEQAPQELSFDEKITKIQKYLPKGLTEKILAQKDRIEGERKHVTVMFLRHGGVYGVV